MNHSLQTLKQLGILVYATIFIKDCETIPPPYELPHLRKFVREAYQLLHEIEELKEPQFPSRIETIIKGLLSCQGESSLVINARFAFVINSIVKRLHDHYIKAVSR